MPVPDNSGSVLRFVLSLEAGFCYDWTGEAPDMIMKTKLQGNKTTASIAMNMIVAAVSLFINGFGIYLTIRANLGAAPWDVLSLGLSKTLGVLYGTASIAVSLTILGIDIVLKEPIGIAMFIDAFVVGKAVDFFNWIDAVPKCSSAATGIPVMLIGIVVLGYTQYAYMKVALGCGPRDTLLVGLSKRARQLPIGAISIVLLGTATWIGWILGGPVGIGTLICAFASGPIMQLAFRTMRFDATAVRHQNLRETLGVIAMDASKNAAGRLGGE